MDSLDIVHGIGGKSGQSPWILWTKSREPTQTGQCPWTKWTKSTVSLVNVHGLPRQCPWTQWKVWPLFTDALDNVQADRTMLTESMGSLDIVHGQSPLSVLTELVKRP